MNALGLKPLPLGAFVPQDSSPSVTSLLPDSAKSDTPSLAGRLGEGVGAAEAARYLLPILAAVLSNERSLLLHRTGASAGAAWMARLPGPCGPCWSAPCCSCSRAGRQPPRAPLPAPHPLPPAPHAAAKLKRPVLCCCNIPNSAPMLQVSLLERACQLRPCHPDCNASSAACPADPPPCPAPRVEPAQLGWLCNTRTLACCVCSSWHAASAQPSAPKQCNARCTQALAERRLLQELKGLGYLE